MLAHTPTFPWGDSRRFNSYTGYIKRTFGGRVQKLTVNAGFSCPNRDGTVGEGGCSYCNNSSFTPKYCIPSKSIEQQLREGMEFHAHRYRRAKQFMAYFQAYSNTYAPLDELKRKYEEALSVPNIIGLVIGTRPDCVDEGKLDYLSTLKDKYHIAIEYGVEACSDEMLGRINRGHTFGQTVWAIGETAKRGINVGAHFILGLPGQTVEDIYLQMDDINSLPINTIKFHQLQIIEDTAFALQYRANPDSFTFYTPTEYLNLMVGVLERLNPAIVVERLTGEASPRMLIAPKWGDVRSEQLLECLEQILESRNTWQGRLHHRD